jgi:hypothetical protein
VQIVQNDNGGPTPRRIGQEGIDATEEPVALGLRIGGRGSS